MHSHSEEWEREEIELREGTSAARALCRREPSVSVAKGITPFGVIIREMKEVPLNF